MKTAIIYMVWLIAYKPENPYEKIHTFNKRGRSIVTNQVH